MGCVPLHQISRRIKNLKLGSISTTGGTPKGIVGLQNLGNTVRLAVPVCAGGS